MRLNLDLEDLHVESTVVEPEYQGFEGEGAVAASVLYNTQTRPIPQIDTNDTRCWA